MELQMKYISWFFLHFKMPPTASLPFLLRLTISKYYHFIYNDLLNSGSRATALYCLLSQAVRSMMEQEK